MKKRFLALLLALAVLFMGSAALADEWDDEDWDDEDWGDEEFEDEEEFEDDDGAVDFKTIAGYDSGEKYVCGDFVYQLYEDGQNAYTVSYNGSAKDVVVPDTLDGHPVLAIGDFTFNFKDCIETVTLPATVTSIGNMAFFKCTSLKTIVIPEGVTMLDRCCFGGCESLEEVVMAQSVETVGEFAFLACARLREISFGPALKSVGPSAFQMCISLTSVRMPAATEVGEDAFTDCSESLTIIPV